MSVDPKHTAVVLIEYQNDFTSEGGALHGAVQDVMEKTGMLQNTRTLVEAARAAGATIVYAPITFAPGYGKFVEHPYGILKGVVDSTAFVKGEWGAEIVDALAPHEGDVIVEGKRGLDTFATTNLDFILRARGITTIALVAADELPAVSSRPCGPAMRRATRSSRCRTALRRPQPRSMRTRSGLTTRCSRR